MHRSHSLAALTLCLSLGAIACQSTTTTKSDIAANGRLEPLTADDMQAQTDAWEKLATPGEAHKRLEPLIGRFQAETTMWMDPQAEPQRSTGIMANRWILGERFVLSEFEGEAMDMPFEGLGLMGYDNGKQRYVGTWCDTWGTMLMPISEGTADASGRVFTMSRVWDCPVTKKLMKMREVLTIESPDKHSFEMWSTGPDGVEYKAMTILYTRVRA